MVNPAAQNCLCKCLVSVRAFFWLEWLPNLIVGHILYRLFMFSVDLLVLAGALLFGCLLVSWINTLSIVLLVDRVGIHSGGRSFASKITLQ